MNRFAKLPQGLLGYRCIMLFIFVAFYLSPRNPQNTSDFTHVFVIIVAFCLYPNSWLLKSL